MTICSFNNLVQTDPVYRRESEKYFSIISDLFQQKISSFSDFIRTIAKAHLEKDKIKIEKCRHALTEIVQNDLRAEYVGKSLLAHLEEAPPHYGVAPPQNLIFQGGGSKGIAFLGAFEVLNENRVLEHIVRVAGTSAGAIYSTFVALGFSIEEMRALLETDFSTFLDQDPSIHDDLRSFLTSYLLEGKENSIYSFLSDVFSNRTTVLESLDYLISQGINRLIQIKTSPLPEAFTSLHKFVGLCKGESFRKWMEANIYAKTRIPHCTFGELKELVAKNKAFKHLHVYTLKSDSPHQIVRINSEDPEWKDVIISDAIRASMSIPLIFQPHILHKKIQRNRTPFPEMGTFVDGGVLKNFPIDAFDEKRYLQNDCSLEESRALVFNKRTLGFSFYSPTVGGNSLEVKSIADLASFIVTAYLHQEDSYLDTNPSHNNRIIRINNHNLSLANFSPSEEMKRALITSGELASRHFFEPHRGEIESAPLFADFMEALRKRILSSSSAIHFSLDNHLASLFLENIAATLQANPKILLSSPQAVDWLKVSAYLNPSNISSIYLEQWLNIAYPKDTTLLPQIRDEISRKKIQSFDETTQTFSLESLFHQALQAHKTEAIFDQVTELLVSMGLRWDCQKVTNSKEWEQEALEWEKHVIVWEENTFFEKVSIDNKINIAFQLGSLKFAMKKYPETLVHLTEVSKLNEKVLASGRVKGPQHVLASWRNLRTCHIAQENYAEAFDTNMEIFNAEHPGEPEFPEAQRFLKDHYHNAVAQKKYEKAIELLTITLGVDHPTTISVQKSTPILMLAEGDYEGALRMQKKIIRPDESEKMVKFLKLTSSWCIENGNLEKATEYYSRAIDIQKETPGFDDTLDMLYLKNIPAFYGLFQGMKIVKEKKIIDSPESFAQALFYSVLANHAEAAD